MPRNNKKLDGIFDNPKSVQEFFRKCGQSESARKRKKQIDEGPHPTPEILFDYAVGMLPDSEQEKWLHHIAYCIRCSTEVYSILAAELRLGKVMDKSETREPNWAQSLKNIASSLKIQIQSFVDRMIEVIEPEPALQYMGLATPGGKFTDLRREPGLQEIETEQFVVGEVINFEIIVPADGHVTAFTFPESGPMRLVFPYGSKVDTLVSARKLKRMHFKASEPPGPWTLKVIWTIDDPLGSHDLAFDELWNDRALNTLAEHIKKLDEDKWAAGTFEFEVKNK